MLASERKWAHHAPACHPLTQWQWCSPIARWAAAEIAALIAHVPAKACCRTRSEDGNRFSDMDMRKSLNPERVPIRSNQDAL
jgi:hypothetical protein